MNERKRWIPLAVGTILGASLLLSGCGGKSANPGPTASATSTSAPSKTGKSSASATFHLDTESLVAAPGSTHKLGAAIPAQGGKSGGKGGLPSGVTFSVSPSGILTVDANGAVKVSDQARTGSKATITATYRGQTDTCAVTVKYSLADTIKTVGGKPTVTNLSETAILVNKSRYLPSDYVPPDLVEPNIPFNFKEKSEKRLMRKDAARALEELVAAADKDKIKLYGVSAYRSYAYQKGVFDQNVKSQGEAAARRVSAEPGTSEHQTGLAIDIYANSAPAGLVESFGDTVEGKWLAKHAADFGFIIRYPKGKENITGYSYEPWHIRYVGVDISREIVEKNETFEEYFEDATPVSK